MFQSSGAKRFILLNFISFSLRTRERRLHWFGRVARSGGAVGAAYDMQIDGGPGGQGGG